MGIQGMTAMERIHQRNVRSARVVWLVRIPLLALIAISAAIVWLRVGGLPGAVIAGVIVGVGVWSATVNPWKKVHSV